MRRIRWQISVKQAAILFVMTNWYLHKLQVVVYIILNDLNYS